jgi:hypothetical protein
MNKPTPFQRKFTLNDTPTDQEYQPNTLSPTADRKVVSFKKAATKSLTFFEQLFSVKVPPTMVQSAEIPKLEQWSVEP